MKKSDLPPHLARLIAADDRAWFEGRPMIDNERIGEPVDVESDLHESIRKELAARGWIGFHGSMAHRSRRTVGEPDWIILGDTEQFWMIECKTKTGKLSPAQEGLRAWARKLGHEVHVVRSMAEFLLVIEGGEAGDD